MDTNITTPLAAFVAGLATSLHCTAMCGPLACALRVRPWEYHLTRLLSYTLAGALCGAVGQGLAAFLQGDVARLVPWFFAAVLVILAFGLEKRLPQPRFVARLAFRARLHRSLGWLSPLLPCGPLWLMFGIAALTSSWYIGALHLAAFALGTIPLPFILLAQTQRLQRQFSPGVVRWTQRTIALAAAAVLVWRAALPLHECCH